MKRVAWLLLLAACSSGPEPDVNSPHPYGRYLGAIQLADNPDAASVATLVKMLDDPDYLVRSGAVVALGKIGRPEFVQQIVPKLSPEAEKNPMVRSDACLTLGKLENPEAIQPLLETMESDPNNVVRREAAKALSSFGKRPEVLSGLARAVGDSDASVAWRAHVSLKNLTGAKEVAMTTEAWTSYVKEHP